MSGSRKKLKMRWKRRRGRKATPQTPVTPSPPPSYRRSCTTGRQPGQALRHKGGSIFSHGLAGPAEKVMVEGGGGRETKHSGKQVRAAYYSVKV